IATSPNQHGMVGADSGAIWIWTEACVILGVSSPFKMTYVDFVNLLRRHLFLSFYNTSPLLSMLFFTSSACCSLVTQPVGRARMFSNMAHETFQEVSKKRFYRLFHAFLKPAFASAVTV